MAEPATAPRPWGLWPTLLLSLVAVLVFFGSSLLIFLILELTRGKSGIPAPDPASFPGDGEFYTLATVVSAPLAMLFLLILIRIRKNPPPRDYLALKKVRTGTMARWLLLTLPLIALVDLFLFLTSNLVHEFMIDLYTTASCLPTLLIALALFSPLFEETLFRGFLYRGIRESRLGAWGAVMLSAVFWTMLHWQYDPPGMLTIFCFGIFLGIARERSGSLCVPFSIHALVNLAAMIETYVYVECMR